MRGDARRYFPGDACRGHVRIKSFRAANTFGVQSVYQLVYEISALSVFSRVVAATAADPNSRDRRAGIFKQPSRPDLDRSLSIGFLPPPSTLCLLLLPRENGDRAAPRRNPRLPPREIIFSMFVSLARETFAIYSGPRNLRRTRPWLL